MPNQRKKGKVHLGGYFDKRLIEELNALAKERRIPRSQLVDEILQDALKRYERRRAPGV